MSQTGGERGDASTFRYPRHSPATNERNMRYVRSPRLMISIEADCYHGHKCEYADNDWGYTKAEKTHEGLE